MIILLQKWIERITIGNDQLEIKRESETEKVVYRTDKWKNKKWHSNYLNLFYIIDN